MPHIEMCACVTNVVEVHYGHVWNVIAREQTIREKMVLKHMISCLSFCIQYNQNQGRFNNNSNAITSHIIAQTSVIKFVSHSGVCEAKLLSLSCVRLEHKQAQYTRRTCHRTYRSDYYCSQFCLSNQFSFSVGVSVFTFSAGPLSNAYTQWAKTFTKFSASKRMPTTTKSRRHTESWRSNTIRTRIKRPAPKSDSKRWPKPMRCCRTRRSGTSTTSTARRACTVAHPPLTATPMDRPSRTSSTVIREQHLHRYVDAFTFSVCRFDA